MDLSARKEQFSAAYVQAVATVAGYALGRPAVDDDSVDCTFYTSGLERTRRRPRLDAQLKCSARELLHGEHLAFPLSLKNYDDLRPEDVLVPRILVVLLVPERLEDWLIQDERGLTMAHSAYWLSLRGLPAVPNQQTATVHVPRNQLFTPAALAAIMSRVDRGGHP
jgi:hypothetical protein